MSDDKQLERDELFKEEEILDHDYDGIRELNNGMPFWLSSMFMISIIFGCLYYIHYTSGSGPTLYQEFLADMKEFNLKKEKAALAKEDVNYLESLSADEIASIGASNYTSKCAACHGPAGGGGIGPNLTDAYWIHGNASKEDIQHVIQTGVLDKGMPAWSQVMSAKEIAATSLYIVSLKGTNPPGAKEAQGNKVE